MHGRRWMVATTAAVVAVIAALGVSASGHTAGRRPIRNVQARTSATSIDVWQPPTDMPATASAPADTAAPASGDVAIPPAPDQFDAPAPVPSPGGCRVTSPAPPGGGVWSVVVGVNDYPGTRFDLTSAVNDARDVDLTLQRFGVPGDHRLLLLDGQATGCAVRAGLDWLVNQASPDATVVFFFAGHARKLAPTTESLIASDADALTDVDLAGHLSGLRAAHTWLGIATCYAAGFNELLAPGRVLTAASAADQLAYENDAFHRSYLVEYLVHRAMLGGQAASSVEASFGWAAAALQRDFPDRVPVMLDASSSPVDVHEPGAPRPSPSTQSRSGSPPPRSPSRPPQNTTTTAPPPRNGCSQLSKAFGCR